VLSRRRRTLLERALNSLNDQDGVEIRALVMIDDCHDTLDLLKSLTLRPGAIKDLEYRYLWRGSRDHTGPVRAGKLREMALDETEGKWLGFLDDDNTLMVNHYSSLLQCIEEHASLVAHSWRTLWNRDKTPYVLRSSHPWCRDRDMAEKLFREYSLAGIYVSGSNIVRDQVVPGEQAKSMVDTSEWIFHRNFVRGLSWTGPYDHGDWLTSRAEDSLVLDQIVNLRIDVPCSRQPTLCYFLGGYSNQMIDERTDSRGWLSSS
jgi:hypothetical protein